jgi:hypothetical protein
VAKQNSPTVRGQDGIKLRRRSLNSHFFGLIVSDHRQQQESTAEGTKSAQEAMRFGPVRSLSLLSEIKAPYEASDQDGRAPSSPASAASAARSGPFLHHDHAAAAGRERAEQIRATNLSRSGV